MKKPGRQLNEQEALSLMQRFWAKYREPEKRGPTWLRFKVEANVTPAIFDSPTLDAEPFLYVFFDSIRQRHRQVWGASASEVRGLFADRSHPGQDVFVFPATMRWCIAFPEERNGNDFIVQLGGDVSSFPGVR